ncbi:hypothetical protein BC937DRAFT_90503 [Endogone sp. FLAS-F59071]|nr:hypothetical protein BC937DRAFT_90503 [Endogone sp. FLAS-F59071]|eukprot:RUS17044.1 hypothetical protein BC937DRAFT_90503 [Endogone sp. FLAS-F59071]
MQAEIDPIPTSCIITLSGPSLLSFPLHTNQFRVLPCSIVPLAGHPHEWTLSNKKYVVLRDLRTGHPHYHLTESYAALRLDDADGPVGIIGVMDTRPMEMDRAVVINDVIDGVSKRVTAEIVRLRSEARLIRAKENAEQDADNKTKFLAGKSSSLSRELILMKEYFIERRDYF